MFEAAAAGARAGTMSLAPQSYSGGSVVGLGSAGETARDATDTFNGVILPEKVSLIEVSSALAFDCFAVIFLLLLSLAFQTCLHSSLLSSLHNSPHIC